MLSQLQQRRQWVISLAYFKRWNLSSASFWHIHTTTILRPFFRDNPSRLTSAYLHRAPYFLQAKMPFLPPNQQHQSTEVFDTSFEQITLLNLMSVTDWKDW